MIFFTCIFLGAFAVLRTAVINCVMSVCPSVCAPTGGIFIKFDIRGYFRKYVEIIRGPASSVVIRSGDRIPVGGEIFRLSRPALDPSQPSVKRVPGLYRGKSTAGAYC